MKNILYTICFLFLLSVNSIIADWMALNSPITGTIQAMAKNGNIIYLGTKDAGVLVAEEPYSNFSPKNSGISNNRIHALEYSDDKLAAGSYGEGIYLSTNNAQSWTSYKSGMAIPYVFTILFNSGDIFAGADKGVYKSSDNGQTWNSVLIENYTTNHLYKYGSDIYCAIGPSFYKSTDNGSNWTKIVTGNTTLKQVLILNNSGTDNIFIGALDGVYKSTDAGKSWKKKNTGLTYQNIMTIVAYGNDIFVGTDMGGVFQSSDYAESWKQINSGFPTEISIPKLIVDGNDLFAASSNGIVWKRSLKELVNSVNESVSDAFRSNKPNYPNPFIERTSISFNLKTDSFVTISIYDLLGNLIENSESFRNSGENIYNFETSGKSILPGTYQYVISAGKESVAGFMLYCK